MYLRNKSLGSGVAPTGYIVPHADVRKFDYLKEAATYF
jgi:hypothetical protein